MFLFYLLGEGKVDISKKKKKNTRSIVPLIRQQLKLLNSAVGPNLRKLDFVFNQSASPECHTKQLVQNIYCFRNISNPRRFVSKQKLQIVMYNFIFTYQGSLLSRKDLDLKRLKNRGG